MSQLQAVLMLWMRGRPGVSVGVKWKREIERTLRSCLDKRYPFHRCPLAMATINGKSRGTLVLWEFTVCSGGKVLIIWTQDTFLRPPQSGNSGDTKSDFISILGKFTFQGGFT